MYAPRLALCAATLALSVTLTGAADAGCNTFTDPAGDAHGTTLFDIRGGDMTVSKKSVTAVLSLPTTKPSADPFGVLGGKWTMVFMVGPTRYELWREIAPATATATAGMTVDRAASKAKPVVKVGAKTITWTVPRSAVKSSKAPICGAYSWTYNAGIGTDYGGP